MYYFLVIKIDHQFFQKKGQLLPVNLHPKRVKERGHLIPVEHQPESS